MSTFNIFKSYEDTYDNALNDYIEYFDTFINKIKVVYKSHNMSFEFEEFKDYNENWIIEGNYDDSTFIRDGYSSIMYRFDLVLCIYANMSSEWLHDEMRAFLYYAKNNGRRLNLCAIFLSDGNISPEVVALKKEIEAEFGDGYIEIHTYNELKFNFLLQLRGLCYYDDTRIMVNGAGIDLEDVDVCGVSEVSYLKDNEERAQQIIDALSFAMALRNNNMTHEFGCQIVKLLKLNKNKSIAKLLDYKNLKAQIAEQIKLHTKSDDTPSHDTLRILLSKLKLFALNTRILESDTAESRRLNRKYYKDRYEAMVKCHLPLWDTASALLDYISFLKDEKRAVTLMEECVARYFDSQKGDSPRSYREAPGNSRYLGILHDKIIAYYEKVKEFDKVVEICLSEIERERSDGYGIRCSRPKTLYSKLGAIYEAKLTDGECVL